MNRNFNDIYKAIYSNGVEELNVLKKRKDINLTIIIVLIIGILLFYKQILKSIYLTYIVGIILVAFLMMGIIITGKYRKAFKESIISKIVKLYDSNLTYSPNIGVTASEYMQSKFDTEYSKFYVEDLISGFVFENNLFKMSQVKTYKEVTETDSEGNTTTREELIFFGLFGVAYINNNNLPEIELKSNNFKHKFNKKRIEVDSAEFEKNYDIFSNDKVHTMQILDSELIEEFNKFKEKVGKALELKIKDNTLFFRIHCGECFEAPMVKNALDFTLLHNYFKMIDEPVNLIVKILEKAKEIK